MVSPQVHAAAEAAAAQNISLNEWMGEQLAKQLFRSQKILIVFLRI